MKIVKPILNEIIVEIPVKKGSFFLTEKELPLINKYKITYIKNQYNEGSYSFKLPYESNFSKNIIYDKNNIITGIDLQKNSISYYLYHEIPAQILNEYLSIDDFSNERFTDLKFIVLGEPISIKDKLENTKNSFLLFAGIGLAAYFFLKLKK
jgi:hypothetical protein